MDCRQMSCVRAIAVRCTGQTVRVPVRDNLSNVDTWGSSQERSSLREVLDHHQQGVTEAGVEVESTADSTSEEDVRVEPVSSGP